MVTRKAACSSSSTMPTDGISSGGSSAIGARLLPTKRPSKPSTMLRPVISMAESGSSGVTRARASRNGRRRGSLSPIGPVGETERAQQCGRGRDQELDPVGHGFPYQSSDEVGSHRGVSRRTPAAASREYTSDGLLALSY